MTGGNNSGGGGGNGGSGTSANMPGGGNLIKRVANSLRRDPKKTAALAVLAAVLVGMGGKMLLRGGAGRSSPAAAASSANSTTGSRGGGGGGARERAANKSAFAGAVNRSNPGAAAALHKWAEADPGPVSRNLFAVRMEFFPMDGSRTTQSDTPDDGFWARLEKSLAQQADLKFKHENLIASYTQQASELKLQSIVMGPQPRAMVNGELVGEGGVVASFRVLKIEARRLIVEREGIRLEIQMK